jgi:hypothetical protein
MNKKMMGPLGNANELARMIGVEADGNDARTNLTRWGDELHPGPEFRAWPALTEGGR